MEASRNYSIATKMQHTNSNHVQAITCSKHAKCLAAHIEVLFIACGGSSRLLRQMRPDFEHLMSRFNGQDMLTIEYVMLVKDTTLTSTSAASDGEFA